MINNEYPNNSDAWNTFCYRQYKNHTGPDYKIIWNGKIDSSGLKYFQQSFYEDVHGTKKCIEKEISPSAVFLTRSIVEESHSIHQQIKKILNLKIARISINIQEPGGIIPLHIDQNRSFMKQKNVQNLYQNLEWKDIKRYFYFWEDQTPGQFMQIGNTQITWKAGDLIEWPYYAAHSTANTSYLSRKIASIIGILA